MMNESNHARKKANYAAYLRQFQPEKIIKLQDGGNSFLDEIEEDVDHVPVLYSGRADLNEAYTTNKELLGELKVKEFDLFEMVINKFNMQ